MENVVNINKEVSVVAYYFRSAGQRLRSFPRKVEFDGKSVVFTDDGRQRPSKKGERLVHLFKMSDGQDTYRLEYDDADASWKLLSIGA